jgi:hypothetical protein
VTPKDRTASIFRSALEECYKAKIDLLSPNRPPRRSVDMKVS